MLWKPATSPMRSGSRASTTWRVRRRACSPSWRRGRGSAAPPALWGPRGVAGWEIGLHDEEVSMPNIVQLRAARNRRAPPEIWQATYSWIGGQRLMPLSPLRHAPKPMQRIEARRQLWNPYLEVLEGTRHAGPFRRTVFQQMRAPGLEPRRTRPLPPHRPAGTRPAVVRERT